MLDLVKSVLLTRSIDDNEQTIKDIENLIANNRQSINFKYVCSSLVEYQVLEFNNNILDKYTDIIITSKFAAKILANYPNSGPKNVWLVGNSSKLILQQNSHKNNFMVRYVAANIQDLLANIPSEIYKQTIYLSSNEITQNLPEQITRQVIYRVKYADQLHHIEEIAQGVNFILLYSHNSAKTFLALLEKNNLLKILDSSLVITISEKVANIIRPFCQNVLYCNDNEPQRMLELLIEHAKTRN